MTSKPVSGLARAALGGALVCVIFLCSFAALSPVLHKALHPDAQAADHSCQLGLWAKDQFLTPSVPSAQPPIVLTIFLAQASVQVFSSLLVSSAFPTRGPPSIS